MTADGSGNSIDGTGYAGTFTAGTFPTATAVEELCQFAADDLELALATYGVDEIPTGHHARAQHVAKYQAAALVEDSYRDDPDGSASATSSNVALYLKGVAGLAALINGQAEQGGGTLPGGAERGWAGMS